MSTIPYRLERREDTGIDNGRLAIWLFLASEVLFFGALLSSYLLLRMGSEAWPRGSERLDVAVASVNTLVLILSSVTMVRAWEHARVGRHGRSRVLVLVTAALGIVFVAIKAYEWREKLQLGIRPADDLFYALYFTLTGVHLVHLVAGIVVLLDLALRARSIEASQRGLLAHRLEISGIYWHFVDMVWVVRFPVLYVT